MPFNATLLFQHCKTRLAHEAPLNTDTCFVNIMQNPKEEKEVEEKEEEEEKTKTKTKSLPQSTSPSDTTPSAGGMLSLPTSALAQPCAHSALWQRWSSMLRTPTKVLGRGGALASKTRGPVLICEGCDLSPTTKDMLFERTGFRSGQGREREREKVGKRTWHKISKGILKSKDH